MKIAEMPYLRVVLHAAANFQNDSGLLLAAAVSFYILLSIAPLLYLIAFVVGVFFLSLDAQRAILETLETMIPSEALPGANRIIGGVRLDGKIAVIAVPGLLWVGTTAFGAFEVAVNLAFGIRHSMRRIWRGRLLGFATLVVGGVLLGVTSASAAIVAQFGSRIREFLELSPAWGVSELLSNITIQLLALAAFLALYRIVPAVRVGWKAAAAGALTALILWNGTLYLFGAAIGRSPASGMLTGTLAGSLAFLLWIYATVGLTLYGAEVAAIVSGSRQTPSVAPRREP